MKQTWIVPLFQLVGGDMIRDGRRPRAGDGDPSKDVEDLAAESVDFQVDRRQGAWLRRRGWRWQRSLRWLIDLRHPQPRVVGSYRPRIATSGRLLLLGRRWWRRAKNNITATQCLQPCFSTDNSSFEAFIHPQTVDIIGTGNTTKVIPKDVPFVGKLRQGCMVWTELQPQNTAQMTTWTVGA